MSAARRAAASREPTAEQLRMAWPHFRGRGRCPDTLAATLAHPVFGPALRRAAQLMGRPSLAATGGAAAQAAARLGQGSYVHPTPTAPPAPPRRDDSALGRWPGMKHQPVRTGRWGDRLGAHDAKRAAANDRDEDARSAA
jgi:hypothetical protein